MKPFPFLMISLSLVLSACSSNPVVQAVEAPVSTQATSPQPEVSIATLTSTPEPTKTTFPELDLLRIDEQGMVIVEVTPLNLSDPGDTLTFEVGLNTHSVDLSMDLAELTVLTLDNGMEIQASQWDAPRGGHHVSGKLHFPALPGGQPVLQDAREIRLVIKDLDAPERIFTWELTP